MVTSAGQIPLIQVKYIRPWWNVSQNTVVLRLLLVILLNNVCIMIWSLLNRLCSWKKYIQNQRYTSLLRVWCNKAPFGMIKWLFRAAKQGIKTSFCNILPLKRRACVDLPELSVTWLVYSEAKYWKSFILFSFAVRVGVFFHERNLSWFCSVCFWHVFQKLWICFHPVWVKGSPSRI